MNLDLVRSRHVVLAAALLAVVAAFAAFGTSAARPFEIGGRAFQVGSGFVALALLIAVAAYGARKYAHRGGYSPEFRMRREFEALERADRRVRELRARIASGSLASQRAVEDAARAILREEGVHRVRRPLVEPGGRDEPPFKVRIAPTEPLGRVRRWMHVHLAWGTAFGVVVLLHARGVPDSAHGMALAAVVAVVWVSGLVGLVAWMKGPAQLTQAEGDLAIEEAHALRENLSRKLAAELAGADADQRRALERVATSDDAAATLASVPEAERARFEDLLVLATQTRLVTAEHARLARIRRAMMAWKFAHVPAAILLLALAALHVLAVWAY